jgi:hypothetical protein
MSVIVFYNGKKRSKESEKYMVYEENKLKEKLIKIENDNF